MRILLVHNYYGSAAPSGENQVVEAEVTMLRSAGHEVELFDRHSDEIRQQGARGILKGAIVTPWNHAEFHRIRRVVADFQPDIVHAHNTFPLVSPAVFHAVGQRAARVLTLHNYRLFCPAGIPMRAGKVCTDCLDQHSSLPAIHHGCYRGSRLATLPLAASVGLHRLLGTWRNQVDAFIALSDFQKERMVFAGLPAHKVHVKPNFYPGNPLPIPYDQRKPQVVFAGRLTEEKGVEHLVRAWLAWGDRAPELVVIGDGPLRPALQQLADKNTAVPIRFLGQLQMSDAIAQIAASRLLVVPSNCYEGFPMVVREAFAFGTPVAASNIGPLPFIIREGENGALFEPANPASLLRTVQTLWTDILQLSSLANKARNDFEEKYTESANIFQLMKIYKAAQNTQAAPGVAG